MSVAAGRHLSTVSEVLWKCDSPDLDKLCDWILAHSLILTCGNGGSAATAMHFAGDLRSLGLNAFDMLSPVKTTQLMNDAGPGAVFNHQCIRDALVIAFSCSGTSQDIERLFCQSKSDLVVMTSTINAKNKSRIWDKHDELGALIIEICSSDYEVIEDCHLAICHAVKKELKERLSKS